MTVAEEALLGSMILSPSMIDTIEGVVSGEDFTETYMENAFNGIREMRSRGLPIDQISVGNKFPEWEIKRKADVVWQWTTHATYGTLIFEYAKAVRRDSLKRSLLMISGIISEQTHNEAFEPLDVATDASNMLEKLREGARVNGLTATKLSSILEGDDSYDWLIPGLLERQDRLIVTGPEGFGKTTFIRQIAILAAAGINPITFEKITPVRVLVVDAENTERQWRRAVRYMADQAGALGSADPRETIHIAAGRRIDITRGSHLSEIHKLVDFYKPDILMIGPLYKLVPNAINNDDDASPLIVALDSLRDRGLCLIMEAHAGKATNMEGDRDLRPRGSAALLGWPEFGFGLKPVTGDPEKVQLARWRGDRDGRAWPKIIRKGGIWPWMTEENFIAQNAPGSDWF